MEFTIDSERYENKETWGSTGIFVRAQHTTGKWESVDIVLLSKDSLLAWLKSRGGDNPYAEDVVGILFGHGHLHNHA